MEKNFLIFTFCLMEEALALAFYYQTQKTDSVEKMVPYSGRPAIMRRVKKVENLKKSAPRLLFPTEIGQPQRAPLQEKNGDEFSVRPPKTTLIMAPHPDDEILCCATTIQEKIAKGEKVKIVFWTSGDGKKSDFPSQSVAYGKQREGESVMAAEKLGLKKSDLFFLNFPDQGLEKLPHEGRFTSPYTTKDKTGNFAYFPRTPYNQNQLEFKIQKLINLFHPEEIYYPNPQKDKHPDHKSCGLTTEKILKNNLHIEGHSYTIHAGNILSGKNLPAESIAITDVKIEEKFSLIQIFKTQFHDEAHKKFLESFAFIPEKFDRFWREVAQK